MAADIVFKNKKEFEERLEYHIFRGYIILHSSVKMKSNLYEFLLQDFGLD